MAEHPHPRWMTVLWFVLVLCITGSFIAVSLWHGYDFVQTVGFLAVYFYWIFALSLLAGLVPYAVSLLLGLRRRKLPDELNRSKPR
jgi:peptidoglycan biosynthesis protein MviN/MurJ (putative lipid II flippase)